MRVGILAKKIGMTQVFDETGGTVPVTLLQAQDCIVTQVKSGAKDKYAAVQLGIGSRKPQNVTRAQAGHFKKAHVQPKARLQEVKFENDQDMSQIASGKQVSVSTFQKGDVVDVIGYSKGRGFTGVMKRFNFAGKHATHGTSKYFRHGGSNGANTFPGRVIKNKGMPGHMGDAKVTAQNLRVVEVIPEDGLILVRGTVPGARNGILKIRLAQNTPHKDRQSVFA